MRIGYFADGYWGLPTLHKLIANKNIHIVFLASRYHGSNYLLDPIAEKAQIPILRLEDINSKKSLSIFAKYQPDVLLSMSFLDKFHQNLLTLAPFGSYNAHASLLPEYRGRNCINWAIIKGEVTTGVTIHKMDLNYDTGPIAYQKSLMIDQNEHFASILKRMGELCANAIESWLQKDQFIKPLIAQSTHLKTDYRKRGPGDEWVDWNQNAKSIHNFIRGISDPGPYAHTHIKNDIYIIKDSRWVSSDEYKNQLHENNHISALPGEIISAHDNHLWVQTQQDILKIRKIALNDKKTENSSLSLSNILGSRFENH
ncbi:MAG: methionyl-tRNA formyltransferase [Oligoflexales bacterium]